MYMEFHYDNSTVKDLDMFITMVEAVGTPSRIDGGDRSLRVYIESAAKEDTGTHGTAGSHRRSDGGDSPLQSLRETLGTLFEDTTDKARSTFGGASSADEIIHQVKTSISKTMDDLLRPGGSIDDIIKRVDKAARGCSSTTTEPPTVHAEATRYGDFGAPRTTESVVDGDEFTSRHDFGDGPLRTPPTGTEQPKVFDDPKDFTSEHDFDDDR